MLIWLYVQCVLLVVLLALMFLHVLPVLVDLDSVLQVVLLVQQIVLPVMQAHVKYVILALD